MAISGECSFLIIRWLDYFQMNFNSTFALPSVMAEYESARQTTNTVAGHGGGGGNYQMVVVAGAGDDGGNSCFPSVSVIDILEEVWILTRILLEATCWLKVLVTHSIHHLLPQCLMILGSMAE